jgi:L-threonylcarbamoyladenylate synthase
MIGEVRRSTSNVRSPGLAFQSPGLLRKHYSPKARLVVFKWRDEADLRSQLAKRRSPVQTTHVIAHSRIPPSASFGGVSVIPDDAEAFARAIYAEFHRCDEAGAELIVVEALPEGAEWRAIADRLRRAAA